MAEPAMCPVARRAVLLGAGGAGLTALLAACGPAGPPDPAGQAAPATAEAPANPPAATAVEPPAGPDIPQGALVEVGEVPVGGGILVDDILVVQPRKGAFLAYDAVCPHQNVLVSEPDSDGIITCTGHLSHFRMRDGSRVDGPAPRGLRKIDVRVTDGHVVQL